MAIAVVQEWHMEVTDRATPNYDAITERLQAEGPIDGLRVHTAGFFTHGFRIFEVWESREHFERFMRDRLVPLIQEVASSDSRQPQTEVYELHAFRTA
jgi:hypothetical protein